MFNGKLFNYQRLLIIFTDQCIGFRENLNRKPLLYPWKYGGLPCTISHKPIQQTEQNKEYPAIFKYINPNHMLLTISPFYTHQTSPVRLLNFPLLLMLSPAGAAGVCGGYMLPITENPNMMDRRNLAAG